MSNMREAFEKAGYEGAKKQDSKPVAPVPAAGNFNLTGNYTERANQVIKDLKDTMGRNYNNFTTSKIRNILAQVSEIYNDVVIEKGDVLGPEFVSRIEYLKVRLVYECGREPYVIKPFVNKAEILDLLNNIGDSRENFIKFARYMEALVAYHRFHGGKD